MATYRQIHTHIWDDARFEEYSPHAKLLFVYGFSNRHRNESGLYTVTIKKICFETGLTNDEVIAAMEEIIASGAWKYDYDNSVLWVKNAIKYQSVNKFTIVAILKDLSLLKSPLIEEFKEYNKDILPPEDTPSEDKVDPMETPSIPPDNPNQTPRDINKDKDINIDKGKGIDNILLLGAEDSAPTQTDEKTPFITLTLNDKSEYPVFDNQIAEWEELFPAVDVQQELRTMRAWCISHVQQRKTKRGILKFITDWLSRDQDKGGTMKNKASSANTSLRERNKAILEEYLNE